MLKVNRAKNLIGKRFGRLVVLAQTERPHDCKIKPNIKPSFWECRCDCGNVIIRPYYALKNNKTRSCGCLAKDAHTIHNMSKTTLYNRWDKMRSRCRNPNTINYHLYGARGIKVCDEWTDFSKFYEWAIANGYSENLELDRVDPNGDYSPENCRWVPRIVNARNKRNSLLITVNEKTKSISEWAEMSGIPRQTIDARLRRGWVGERLLEPVADNARKRKE